MRNPNSVEILAMDGKGRGKMKTTEEIGEYVIVPVKQHVNLGDFHNTETRM